MKRLLLSLGITSTLAFSANAQHMTLHELFTGENCPPCAAYNPGLWSLCDANPTKVINITYMTPIPTTGVFYQSQSTVSAGRRSYYSVNSAPHGKFDGNAPGTGTPTSTGFTQSNIDTRHAVSSPFVITATHYFNATNDTVFGKVKIKAITATNSGKLKLRAAFTKTMHFVNSPGTNGEKDYPNVVRAMFTATSANGGFNGQSIATNWAAGDSMVYTYKGKISKLDSALAVSKPFTKIDSNFIVWIQNDTTLGTDAKMVYLASKSTYQMPSTSFVSNVTSNVSDITIFPNPASNFVKVTATLAAPSKVNVTILNIIGQVVAQMQYPAANTQFAESITLPNLSNGIYSLNFTTEGETITKQFNVSK